MISDNELHTYTEELVRRAEIKEEGYTDRFLDSMQNHPKVKQEYTFYLMNGSYSCAYMIKGVSIADIIIWQMDHFKALLDNAEAMNKGNQYKMTLLGFDTMMKMEDDPDSYIAKMRATTGTDYLGKF